MELFINQYLGAARFFVPMLSILTIVEILWGRDRLIIAQRLKGLPFWAIQIAMFILAGNGVTLAADSLGVKGALGGGHLPAPHPAIAAIVAAVAFDFGFYCYHRFQHRFLWRWHAPHHSLRNLSALNSHHHWVEPFIGGALMGLPIALIGWKPETLPWLATVFTVQSFAIHSNLRFDVGPLRPFLIGPAYHRIHHSLEPRHWDKNFGALTPLWDWLFGTLYRPDNCPEVGLVDFPEPALKSWFLAPLLYRPMMPISGSGGRNLGDPWTSNSPIETAMDRDKG